MKHFWSDMVSCWSVLQVQEKLLLWKF